MRRLRRTHLIRELVREVAVSKSDLIQPLFVEEGLSKNVPISSMPGQTRFSLSSLEKEAIDLKDRGVRSVLLFGIPRRKDDDGSSAYDSEGIVQESIEGLKEQLANEIVIGTDVCLCQYTRHGHCGIVKDGLVENDATLKRLADTAVSHARAGADIVAPYAMLKAAAREGWIEEKPAILEVLTAIKRAGADMIITYHAKEAAEWLQS